MAIALITILTALWTAGWEFALPCVLAFAMLRSWRRLGWREALLISSGGLLWLALFRATGNRQLYFPYVLYWSGVAALVWTAPASRVIGAALVLALFVVVRMVQDVTQPILMKELIVAALAVWIAVAFVERNPSGLRRFAAAALASIAAFAGLAV